MPPSESAATDRVLDAAEHLFMERGYAGTRLRDIAAVLGIKHTSLYHHAPGGKQELWDRVLERALCRHRDRIEAIAQEAPTLASQLKAVATWLESQPAMNVVAMATPNQPTAAQPQAEAITGLLYAYLLRPVAALFQAARERGEISKDAPDLLAGMFVASINAVIPAHAAGELPRSFEEVADDIIAVLIQGAND
ncbi:MAG: TetR/AcrR family transcriptional regulator [Bacteroidota bacterium]